MFVFTAGNKHYAFRVDRVKEVAELRQFISVPRSPVYLKGAINYRGSLYCIIDISSFFGKGQCNAGECDLIMLSDKDHKVGILAESITGNVDSKALKREAEKEDFISGRYDLDGNDVGLIDSDALFSAIVKNIDDSNYMT